MPELNKPIFVKAVKGKKIRKEDGNWLPESGDTVIFSVYWKRREDDGDVTFSDLPKDKSSKPTAAASTK